MIAFKDLKIGQRVVVQLKDTNPWTTHRPELLEPFEAIVDTAYGDNWIGIVPVDASYLYFHLEDSPGYAGTVLKII